MKNVTITPITLENKWVEEDFKKLTELNLTEDEWHLLYSIRSMAALLMFQNEETKKLFYEDCFLFDKFLSKLYWIDKNRKENNNDKQL